jgi:hypothetical protein
VLQKNGVKVLPGFHSDLPNISAATPPTIYKINGVASETYLLCWNIDKAKPNVAYVTPKTNYKPMRKNTYKSVFVRYK